MLKEEIMDKGMRNSLLVAPMPTASTAQILGNNECFEPYTSNIYTRRTLSGEFIIVNKHLLRDLTKLGLWDEDMKNQLIAANGSVQNIPNIPENLKMLYRTAWEIPQRAILDMAADRGAYICQSQSLNVFMENANAPKLTSMHFHAWRSGLKTGMYYLRTKAATDAIKFTVDKKYKEQPAPRPPRKSPPCPTRSRWPRVPSRTAPTAKCAAADPFATLRFTKRRSGWAAFFVTGGPDARQRTPNGLAFKGLNDLCVAVQTEHLHIVSLHHRNVAIERIGQTARPRGPAGRVPRTAQGHPRRGGHRLPDHLQPGGIHDGGRVLLLHGPAATAVPGLLPMRRPCAT